MDTNRLPLDSQAKEEGPVRRDLFVDATADEATKHLARQHAVSQASEFVDGAAEFVLIRLTPDANLDFLTLTNSDGDPTEQGVRARVALLIETALRYVRMESDE